MSILILDSTNSQSKNWNWKLAPNADSSAEKLHSWQALSSCLLNCDCDPFLAFNKRRRWDRDLFPYVPSASVTIVIYCCGYTEIIIYFCGEQWRLDRYWVRSLFIYLLLHHNSYFGDLSVLLHFNYTQLSFIRNKVGLRPPG